MDTKIWYILGGEYCSSSSRLGPEVGSRKHENLPTGFTAGLQFLEHRLDYKLLGMDSTM
jgi:hypothetical protein